jgi:ATP-dependent DNA helicase RecG
VIKQQKPQQTLSDRCQFIKGVGPARAQRLQNLGVETVNDLLTHFPRRYYDRRTLSKIAQLTPDVAVTFVAQLLTLAQRRSRRSRAMVSAALGDETGVIQVVWFNQPYLTRHLKPGAELIVSGQMSFFRGARQIVNPEFEVLGDSLDKALLHTGRIVPVYPLTAGVSQRFLRDLVARTLDAYADLIGENLPPAVVERQHLPSRLAALRAIHFPVDEEQHQAAVRRLKLEELFYLQLTLALQRRNRSTDAGRTRLQIPFDLERRMLENLPFALTGGQKEALAALHDDLRSSRGMHRLLQGDVGSGKTIVAAAVLLAAVEAGKQAALMVPTEILAVQHARTLTGLYEPLGMRPSLLIGSLKAKEKRAIHRDIAAGEAQVVVGTHALIQEGVSFKDLAVVVIDEQHRFGVRQRARLLTKDRNPHMLVMTATPIPRTLALTAYADLDLSVIEDMPPGRGEVKTRVVTPEKREAMYEFIRDDLRRGARAYFLYPVIDETEKQDLEAAASAYEDLSKGVFKGIPMGLIHGRLGLADKQRAMEDFAAGRIQLLVATTVVEVGVHVPEATLMVIHHPERFGLSQLHQLRGRIGRGGRSGYCFLPVGQDVGAPARERLQLLTQVADGFQIAEADLRIRGPGEFFGVRQHGVPGLKIANPVTDRLIVEATRTHVKRLLETDPRLTGPEGAICRSYLDTLDVLGSGRSVA